MLNSDYLADLEYTFGYFHELSPAHLSFMTLLAGYEPPSLDNVRYLELGSGQGISINIHAASASGAYWGVDVNTDHIAFSNALRRGSGADLTLLEESFEQFAARNDLPTFDMIVLHGIWSWVSQENRATIVELARRTLKPGGLLYLSYNTSPGWSVDAPLRHLLKEHAASQCEGTLLQKLETSLEFVQDVIDADARYFRRNPGILSNFQELKRLNKVYLAHEFLNGTWDVIPFAETARLLAKAELSFISSSRVLDCLDALNLAPQARKCLQEIQSNNLRQTVRDYFVNQRFRCDIFTRGAQRLSTREVTDRLMSYKFTLLYPTAFEDLSLNSPVGQVGLREEVYAPLLEVLSYDDLAPKSLRDLRLEPKLSRIRLPQLFDALLILYSLQKLAITPEAHVPKVHAESALNLNRLLCQKAEDFLGISNLASPVVGRGVPVSELDQLFIIAIERQQVDVPLWVSALMERRAKRIRDDKNNVLAGQEMRNEVARRFAQFQSETLPRLRHLGVIDAKNDRVQKPL